MQESAVLLITFNRLDTTKEVLKALQIVKPKRLYVFSDGARSKEEEKICQEVRNLVERMVDWDCDLRRKYMDHNLGCGPGPFTAMNWAVEEEDRIIILEDDCVPSPAFFPYCNYLLEKYHDDQRIWLISGNNYCPEYKLDTDYIFTHFAHSQGWATWRRCIEDIDLTMQNWPTFRDKRLLLSRLPSHESRFFLQMYDSAYRDKSRLAHVWDVQAGFHIAANGGLGIMPRANLVTNIGYMGTHSRGVYHFHNRPVDDSFKIQIEPKFVVADYMHDRYHFRKHWCRVPVVMRLLKKMHRSVLSSIKRLNDKK